MSVLGDRLCYARQKKGLNVSQAALETHIRSSIIEALEAGNFAFLPPPPYIRGLLRNYALFIGLDPELVLDDYAQETSQQSSSQLPPEPVLPDVPPPPLEESPFPPTPSASIYVPPSRATSLQPPIGRTSLYSSPVTQPPLVAAAPGPIFQVAPEPITTPSTPPPPDPPTLIQWISNTRIPELVAFAAVAITVLALGIFAYTRLSPAPPTPRAMSALPSLTLTVAPTTADTRAPTPVPVLEGAAPVPTNTAAPAGASNKTPVPATAAPGGPQLTLEVTANQTMWVLVIADNVEVFRGELDGATQTWTANERLYFLIKDLPNGTILMNDKQIKANVFAERQLIERAWELSARGTVVSANIAPYHITPSPTPTRTATPPANPPVPSATRPADTPLPAPGPTETPAG